MSPSRKHTVAVITACTYGEDTTADILAAFQAL